MRTGPSPRVGTNPGRGPRSRLLLRLLSLGAGVVLAIGITGVATAGTDDVPGDQPLPGYTINNPPLAPIVVNGATTIGARGGLLMV